MNCTSRVNFQLLFDVITLMIDADLQVLYWIFFKILLQRSAFIIVAKGRNPHNSYLLFLCGFVRAEKYIPFLPQNKMAIALFVCTLTVLVNSKSATDETFP